MVQRRNRYNPNCRAVPSCRADELLPAKGENALPGRERHGSGKARSAIGIPANAAANCANRTLAGAVESRPVEIVARPISKGGDEL